jgi:hypothetical protein
VLAGAKGRVARVAFAGLERYAVTRASTVNLVSEGFGPYFRERYPDVRYSFFTNGIDDEFLEPAGATLAPHHADADAPTRRPDTRQRRLWEETHA